MKMRLMTPEAIKEIESLIPDHEEALMRCSAYPTQVQSIVST